MFCRSRRGRGLARFVGTLSLLEEKREPACMHELFSSRERNHAFARESQGVSEFLFRKYGIQTIMI